MPAIKLMVGLANPGQNYAKTRHNAGAWFVETLMESMQIPLRFEAKFHGIYGNFAFQGHQCHLLIPTTFMNLSGIAVKTCLNYFKLDPENILIAYDEIDLPVGIIRLKFDGGDGGHNGVKDVMRHLHTRQFYRLRIGVGHPGDSKAVINYVLNPPLKNERQEIDLALQSAEQILPLLLNGEIDKAMQRLHTKP